MPWMPTAKPPIQSSPGVDEVGQAHVGAAARFLHLLAKEGEPGSQSPSVAAVGPP
jgi:hypothetical protein